MDESPWWHGEELVVNETSSSFSVRLLKRLPLFSPKNTVDKKGCVSEDTKSYDSMFDKGWVRRRQRGRKGWLRGCVAERGRRVIADAEAARVAVPAMLFCPCSRAELAT